MKNSYLLGALLMAGLAAPAASAQLSTNPDKFLGNITTYGQVDTDGFVFADYWDQLTGENESKWSSCEGNKDSFGWSGADRCYNYCKEHGIPYKWHTLIWGSQYPGWMDNLSSGEQYTQIVEWMDAVKKRYPDLQLIDVVNEAIPGHAPAPYKQALGGDGYTGYDWIIKAFQMAHDRWPDAILIYNDYNTFRWQKTEFINLVKTLRDNGAPIDAYGCQSHDLTDMNFTEFKNAMKEIQTALKMPMYSTEYDIGTANDSQQLQQYKDQIQYMWEQPYVAGITLWGWIYGKTWVTDGNSGIIKNGKDRPAMTWLREYMASDAAKTAEGPFKGGVKELSFYVKPPIKGAEIGNPCNINIEARFRTKAVDRIEFYVDNKLYETLTEGPYVVTYTPEKKKKYNLKAVLYDTEGGSYERTGVLRVHNARVPYNAGLPISLPGTIEFEDFDTGGEGLTFHDSDSKNEGSSKYRDDGEGVDLHNGNGGTVIGYTASGEWLEYTVNVEKAGKYNYELVASSGSDGSSITIAEVRENSLYELGKIDIPNNGDWDSYHTYTGKLTRRLSAGQWVMRVTITGGLCNIDKITITPVGSGIDELSTGPVRHEVYTTTGVYVGTLDLTDEDNVSAMLFDLTSQHAPFVVRNTITGESQIVASRR